MRNVTLRLSWYTWSLSIIIDCQTPSIIIVTRYSTASCFSIFVFLKKIKLYIRHYSAAVWLCYVSTWCPALYCNPLRMACCVPYRVIRPLVFSIFWLYSARKVQDYHEKTSKFCLSFPGIYCSHRRKDRDRQTHTHAGKSFYYTAVGSDWSRIICT